MKVLYSKMIEKKIRRNQLPKEIWDDMRDAFEALAVSGNFRLFDVKKLVVKGPYIYYRLRIRTYRALFHMDKAFIYVEDVGPRGGVYR